MLSRLYIKVKDWLNEETYRESWENQNVVIDNLRLQNTRNIKARVKAERKAEKLEKELELCKRCTK